MLAYLLIGFGGALGAMARALMGSMLPATVFINFPLRIIAVNILGCFAMGFIIELLTIYYASNSNLKIFLTTGFLGGFTTFSSFALEFGQLTTKNFTNLAVSYVLLSVGLSLIAFFIGAKLARLI